MQSILITGSKGKTSVSLIIDHILANVKHATLRVDSTGAYWKQKQYATYLDSVINTGRTPNVMPGRYVKYIRKSIAKGNDNFFAILEAALGCGGPLGTGLLSHSVGILTNIYLEHLNGKDIKTEADVLERKSFIWKKLDADGTFITSLDNKYTKKVLPTLDKNIKTIAVTKEQAFEPIAQITFHYHNKKVFKNGIEFLSLENFLYPIGKDTGMLDNILFAVAATSLYCNANEIESELSTFEYPEEYGRYSAYHSLDKKNIVLVDYAHEPHSYNCALAFLKNYTTSLPVVVMKNMIYKSMQQIEVNALEISKLEAAQILIYDTLDEGEATIGWYGKKIGGKEHSVLYDLLKNKFQKDVIFFNSEAQALEFALKNNYSSIIHFQKDLSSALDILYTHQYKRITKFHTK